MIIQGNELDVDELREGWEEALALILDNPDLDKVYLGARLFTKDDSGRWREVCQ